MSMYSSPTLVRCTMYSYDVTSYCKNTIVGLELRLLSTRCIVCRTSTAIVAGFYVLVRGTMYYVQSSPTMYDVLCTDVHICRYEEYCNRYYVHRTMYVPLRTRYTLALHFEIEIKARDCTTGLTDLSVHLCIYLYLVPCTTYLVRCTCT